MYTVFNYRVLVFISILTSAWCGRWSCQKGLSGTGTKRWKLCVKITGDKLQIKMLDIFKTGINASSQLLTVGFLKQNSVKTKSIDYLEIIEEHDEPIKLKPGKMNCSLVAKQKHSAVVVNCNVPNVQYLSSKSITVYYSLSEKISPEDLMKNTPLIFHFYHEARTNVETFSKAYAKSMVAIVGVALLLTTIITLVVCCCCKQKTTSKKDKSKLKDVSVAFYRDNGEVDSEYSDNDENVAFIPNNNERNSNV